jgi:hypothetical protein
MKEPTLFKVRLLESTAYNDVGDILNVKMVDELGSIYYYDGCHRWCFLTKYDAWAKMPPVKPRKPKLEDYSI